MMINLIKTLKIMVFGITVFPIKLFRIIVLLEKITINLFDFSFKAVCVCFQYNTCRQN